jgi:hypothetical protein
MDDVILPRLEGTATPWRIAAAYQLDSPPPETFYPDQLEEVWRHDMQPGAINIALGARPDSVFASRALSLVMFSWMLSGRGPDFMKVLTDHDDHARDLLEEARRTISLPSDLPSKDRWYVVVAWEHHGEFERQEFDRASSVVGNGLFDWLVLRASSNLVLWPHTLRTEPSTT